MILFNSKNLTNLSHWQVVNDVVMGGCSQAKFLINNAGYGEFSGQVSLENNGGFSSVKYSFNQIDMDAFTKVRIKIKGDAHRYQLRLKSNITDRHSYVTYFETTGNWQEVELDLREFYPTFRGRLLQLSKYPGKLLEEIGFLIGNKESQNFKFQIESISLQ